MTDLRLVNSLAGVPDHDVMRLHAPRHPTALVIPVINEGQKLLDQLDRLRGSAGRVDVVVADGGSTDGSTTPDLLAAAGAATLLVKRGAGRLSAQLRMAFHHCLEAGYESVITMDGNGKDGCDGVARIASALDGGHDFVQGSRFIPGGRAVNTPATRYVAIRMVHAPLTSVAARQRYTDTTNGFRGCSRRLLADPRMGLFRDVFDSYELLAYLPIRAARLGYRVTEVPVSRSYPRTGPTPTKIRGVAAHGQLMTILWSAARGRYDPDHAPS